MEYNYQSSVEDFRVKYTLVVPENSTSEYELNECEQIFLTELEDAYSDIERLTNHADGYDYALAVSSGIIAGFIDSFFVGDWDFKNAKKEANIEVNNKVINFAKKDPNYFSWCEGKGRNSNWKKRDPNRLDSAIEFLQQKYVLPGDNDWKFSGTHTTPGSHHLDDFCHHPTLVGMICCILVQFTGNAKYHPANGETIVLPVSVNEYGNFVSDNPLGKIFTGIINWFLNVGKTLNNRKGHLMSDMAGSLDSAKGKRDGAGIPGTVMSTLKELASLPCFKDTSFAENLRKAYQNGIGNGKSKLNLGIFNNLFEGANNKVDMRTELAVKHELRRQSMPIVVNEIVVRAFYFIRRFIEQMRDKNALMDLEWKKLIPVNNRTIVRMMTIASGTFCLVDIGDAAVRAGVNSGGNIPVFWGKFILRVNFVGVGRFTIAVGTDLYMEARKGRLEMAVAYGEIAATALEEKKVIADTHHINDETDNRISKMKEIGTEIDDLVF